ncbi:MAG TPA: TolC family protein [Sphingobium sp.]|uniref:TolC family protein n=1 Tax=Sphingobium sp. TaxID=1912891 RepID=UPI002ED61B65
MRLLSRFHPSPYLAPAVLLLAGCAPSVRLPAPDIAVPQAFEPRAAGAMTAAQATPVVLDRWWTDFSDPQLAELVTTALDRSTTIRLAYARLSEARATRLNSRSAALPTGSLSGSATEQGTQRLWKNGATTPGQDSYVASFSPSWEIDLFGRLDAIRDRADVNFTSSAFDYEGVRLALAADVASSLFQARYLLAQLETARESLKIAQELAATGRLGFERGLTSAQDAARLNADESSAAAEVTRLTAELNVAKRSLLILIGTPNAATDSLPITSALGAPPALPAATPGVLLTRRPDVRSAELGLQAATLTVKIDRLALFPRFTIQPGIGLSAYGNSSLTAPSGGTGIWSIAAGMAMPILDRARLLSQMRISEARGQQAVVTYEQIVQNAYGEAENALSRVVADTSRAADLTRAASQSAIAFETARRGYRAGLTDLTTLLQIQRTWIQARNARDAARLALLTDSVAAIRALGGGWDASRFADSALQAIQTSGTNP